MARTYKARTSGDPSFNGFASMRESLKNAGLLTTKKGKARRNMAVKCKGQCNGHVEFLSRYADHGFCNACGDELRQSYVHYSRLFRNVRSA